MPNALTRGLRGSVRTGVDEFARVFEEKTQDKVRAYRRKTEGSS